MENFMRAKLFFLLALSFLLCMPASADTKEKLILDPYPSEIPWQEVTNKSHGDQWLREQIPPDQGIETYRDILTAQSFPQQKNADPTSFLKGIFEQVGAVCENVRVNGPKEQLDGGYPIAYAQIYCGKQKGSDFGVNMFFKVIKGDDALYVVHREFRVPPSEVGGATSFTNDQMKQMMDLMKGQSLANSYLVNSVYLCGAKSADKRCGTQQPD